MVSLGYLKGNILSFIWAKFLWFLGCITKTKVKHCKAVNQHEYVVLFINKDEYCSRVDDGLKHQKVRSWSVCGERDARMVGQQLDSSGGFRSTHGHR